MPSLAAYTPLETLLFLQSVARNGADTVAIDAIATSLTANHLIREDDAYNTSRLTPHALHELYNSLVTAEREKRSSPHTNNVNGIVAGDTPRKRKLPVSSPSEEGGSKDENIISDLVDRLYADFKEQTINEIRSDEATCKKLQQEVDELGAEPPTTERVTIPNGPVEVPETHAATVEEKPSSALSPNAQRPEIQRLPPATPAPDRDAHPPSNQAVSAATPTRIGSRPSIHAAAPPSEGTSNVAGDEEKSITSAAQRMPAPSIRGPPDGTPFRHVSTTSGSGQMQLAHPMQASYPSPSGGHLNRNLPPLAQNSQQPRYGNVPPPQPFQASSPRSPVILPPPPGVMSPMRPPGDIPGPYRRTSSGSDQIHGSPMPLANTPHYPHYSPYDYQQSPWPPRPYPPQQFQPHASPYSNPQFFSPSIPANNPHASPTPIQHQYQQHPLSPPLNNYSYPPLSRAGPPPSIPQYVPRPFPAQFPSASSTPSSKRRKRPPFVGISGSSTPWTPKSAQRRQDRHPSPVRPNRDVSPFSDRHSPEAEDANKAEIESAKETTSKPAPKTLEATPSRELKSESLQPTRTGRSTQRVRAASTASSILASKSRSQSVASFTSETRPERGAGRQIRRIKREPPSTPAAPPSDSDQQRSSDRRRNRANTVTSQPSAMRIHVKRKRESSRDVSASPSFHTPRPSLLRIRHHPDPVDPSLVAASKNFARVAGPIMNDIAAHKYAGIFAKPLTERDAPGYKDLIYRPQDLKSIKAAINRGSRAANAGIEEMTGSGDDASGNTPRGSTGSGTVFLKKTDELIPPKGIINSSQLELELIRTFANATMFNPLPTTERGFGPEFKMRRNGDDGVPKAEVDSEDEEEEEEEGGGNKGYVYAAGEEGGIIYDTRDMFESVEKALGNWRSVEQGFGGFDDVSRSGGFGGASSSGGVNIGMRGGSMSDAVADESAIEDEKESGGGGGGGGEGANSVASGGGGSAKGTVRKRRRLAAAADG